MKDIQKICEIVGATSKIDTIFLNSKGEIECEWSSHSLPSLILKYKKHDLTQLQRYCELPKRGFYGIYVNDFKMTYVSLPVFANELRVGVIAVGPLLSEIPSERMIRDLATEKKLDKHDYRQIKEVLGTLKVKDEKEIYILGELLVSLFKVALSVNIPVIVEESGTENHDMEVEQEKIDKALLIEEGHKNRERLLNGIKNGLVDDIGGVFEEKNLLETLKAFGILNRIPNHPLRSMKNITLSHNSLYGRAAEEGGLNAVYVHHMTEKYALIIESLESIEKLVKINREMINEYSKAVKNNVVKGYSPTVKKTFEYVLLNYESQIKIKDIAEKLHISEAHLMRQFKKETGYTITYLVNQKRIEKAKHVLKYSGESVLDVAYSIGYRDPSYFARVFKKLVGVSPKNYRQKQTLLSD